MCPAYCSIPAAATGSPCISPGATLSAATLYICRAIACSRWIFPSKMPCAWRSPRDSLPAATALRPEAEIDEGASIAADTTADAFCSRCGRCGGTHDGHARAESDLSIASGKGIGEPDRCQQPGY